jgi:hypothetical protein
MMLRLLPELVATERPHRDYTQDTDPRNFHSPYRHERHGFWKEIDGYIPTALTGDRLKEGVPIGKQSLAQWPELS